MTSKSIERALQRYRAYKDEDVRTRLEIFGPLLLEAAALSNSLTDEDSTIVREPTEAEILAAAKGGATLLSLDLVRIRPDSFKAGLERLGKVLLGTLKLDEKLHAEAEAFDWTPFTSADFVDAASLSPQDALVMAERLTANIDEALAAVWVYPVLGMTIRAFLDKFARDASQALARTETGAPSFDRRTTCFCCGSEPDIAAVAATTNRGNVKKLYCSTCGASWSFERIRCARCGDEALSDLSYVSDEADDTHRLHICSNCHAAMPTLFAGGDELTFNPDVEGIVLTGLEEAYEAAVTQGTVPQKVLKQGDATQAGRGPGRGLY